MQYLDGETLQQRIAEKPIDTQSVLEIAIQLSDGRRFVVPQRDFIAFTTSKIALFDERGTSHVINTLHVVSIAARGELGDLCQHQLQVFEQALQPDVASRRRVEHESRRAEQVAGLN